ncbi:MAG: type II toxin-antitoxin system RatA family toxin [Congregibacter sp.]
MTSIHRKALLPYSALDLYTLVNDVESYPEFMDGCVGAKVISASDTAMEARLDLARGGIRQSFTTVNSLVPGERIHLNLKNGPFEHFDGVWQFQALAETACKVSLDLEFALRGSLIGAAASHLFERVAANLVDAVVQRAQVIYAS